MSGCSERMKEYVGQAESNWGGLMCTCSHVPLAGIWDRDFPWAFAMARTGNVTDL